MSAGTARAVPPPAIECCAHISVAGAGPIRSHLEDWGSVGSRQPKSLKSPLMSCANAAMPSVTDQIVVGQQAVDRHGAEHGDDLNAVGFSVTMGIFPERDVTQPVPGVFNALAVPHQA